MAINKDLIRRLYQQSVADVVASVKGDGAMAWAWEEEFAAAIVRECSRVAKLETKDNRVCDAIEKHFGVEP